MVFTELQTQIIEELRDRGINTNGIPTIETPKVQQSPVMPTEEDKTINDDVPCEGHTPPTRTSKECRANTDTKLKFTENTMHSIDALLKEAEDAASFTPRPTAELLPPHGVGGIRSLDVIHEHHSHDPGIDKPCLGGDTASLTNGNSPLPYQVEGNQDIETTDEHLPHGEPFGRGPIDPIHLDPLHDEVSGEHGPTLDVSNRTPKPAD